MFMAESYIGHKICWKGDLVVNSLWAWATGLGFSEYQGLVSSAYSVYRLYSEYQDDYLYFHYLLRSSAYDWELTVRSKGIWISRLQLTDESFLDMPIIVPPNDERKAIVRFIHHLDLKVNKLIKAKKKQIELLNEQKQAIIHKAVTRGLDPTVPLKPSGIEWLGDIPSSYQVLPLKKVCNQITDGSHIAPDRNEEIYPFVSTVDLTDGDIDFINCIRTSTTCYEYLVRTGCKPKLGDVLFSKDGSVGKTAIVSTNMDFVVASSLIIITPYLRVLNSSYLDLWLRSPKIKERVESLMHGAGLRRISVEKITRLPIAFPILDIQVDIEKHVTETLSVPNSDINRASCEIDLIKEYRNRLVSDVVTGQLDVRHLDLPEIEDTMLEAIDSAGEEEEEVNREEEM